MTRETVMKNLIATKKGAGGDSPMRIPWKYHHCGSL